MPKLFENFILLLCASVVIALIGVKMDAGAHAVIDTFDAMIATIASPNNPHH